jgi:DNA-binding NtrC family response regulator
MPRAVLVEPDATVRNAIAEVLNNGGLSVIALASGWGIFRLFDRIESPALLVSDINLGPTLDGFKLAIAAQCRWPGLPVICVASHPVRYTTLTCGPFDWFQMTPFTPDGLMDVARCMIAGRRFPC